MRVLNGRVLLAGAFGLVCSLFVSTAVYAAPGGKDAGGNSGYVGWTNGSFAGNASGATTYNAACQAQYGNGARWATANDVLSGGAPDLSNATGSEAWLRGEVVSGLIYNGARFVFKHGEMGASNDFGCALGFSSGFTTTVNGRIRDEGCASSLQIACAL